MIGAWGIGVAAVAMPLELGPEAAPPWSAHAAIAGFVLGPCLEPPCARLRGGELELLHAGGRTERLATTTGIEASLAIAHSRLILASADRPPPDPEVRIAARPRPRAHPAAVDAPAPEPEPIAPPAPVVVAATPPSPAPPAPPSPFEPVPASHAWMSAAVGVGEGLVVAAQGGSAWGPGWLGIGGRVDGAVTADLGGGVVVHHQRIRARIGLWAGAEWWPAECLACSVWVVDQGDGRVASQTASIFRERGGAARWGPVVRAEAELGAPLGSTITWAPRAALAVDRYGPRPELTLAVRWQSP